jgi:RimJ/RimL family protein N-acetyltransferase
MSIDYKVIKAGRENYDDYYKIRSEKHNLYWTGYENPPEYDTFFNWYEGRLDDINRDIYLMYIEGECAGSLHIDYYQGYAAIGYSVKTDFGGKGVGTLIVSEAVNIIKQAKKKRQGLSLIKAFIYHQNAASIKVVEKNDFERSEDIIMKSYFGKEEPYYEYFYEI